MDLFTSISEKDVDFYDRNKTGELGSRLAADTELIMDSVTTNISTFF